MISIPINNHNNLTSQDDIKFRINTDLKMALLDVEFKLERTINELDYSKKIKDSNKIERLNKEKIDYTLKLEYIKKIINKEF